MPEKAAPLKPFYLVDASIYLFRAYYSFPDEFADADGNPTNALNGFAHWLCQFLEETTASAIAVAFDQSLTSSFRNDLYPAYKANRDPAPEQLKRQFNWARDLTAALGIPVLSSSEYEADDLIASVAHRVCRQRYRVVFVTADKDFAQLLAADDILWDHARSRTFRATQIKSQFGVQPAQIADFLALAGDSVDNIPGAPGIGAKTAQRLLGEYGTLEGIYDNLEEIGNLPIRSAARIQNTLRSSRDRVFMFRKLTRLAVDAPLPTEPSRLVRGMVDEAGLDAVIGNNRLGERLAIRLRNAGK